MFMCLWVLCLTFGMVLAYLMWTPPVETTNEGVK